jgi:hypothetical protein
MVGALLLFIAPLIRFYVVPRVEKADIDVYNRSIAEGTGQYFILRQASLSEPRLLRNVTITKSDPETSSKSVFVATQFSRTVDVEADVDIDIALETYVMDRSTGEAVHCCGEDPPKEGYTLKLPFGVEKDEVYPFYDSTARKAFPAQYARDEAVQGLATFVFVSEVPDTVLETREVPGFIVGRSEEASVEVERHYTAETTLWVEPITGAIVKGGQTAMQWFQDPVTGERTVISDTDFINTEDSVQQVVERIDSEASLLRLARFWIPLFAPIAGVILLAVGLWLLLREPRVEPASPAS